MTQIVESDLAQAQLSDELPEDLAHVVRVDRVAVLDGEHQAVVDVLASPSGPLAVLAEFLGQQDADRRLPQVDASCFAVAGLRAPEPQVVVHHRAERANLRLLALALIPVDGEQLLSDDQVATCQVDVVPAQAECFTAAHASHRDQLEDRAVGVVGGAVEEGAELGAGPGVHLRRIVLGHSGVQRRVGLDQTFASSVGEGGADHGVQLLGGRRADTAGGIGLSDVAVQLVEVGGPQVAQADVPEVRDRHADAVAVPLQGLEPDVVGLLLDPALQVDLQGLPAVVAEVAVVDFADDLGHGGRGFGLGAEPGLAELLALPGLRVAADVDDVGPGSVPLRAGLPVPSGVVLRRAGAPLDR